MSDDIVERLREHAKLAALAMYKIHICWEAAAEIERLRGRGVFGDDGVPRLLEGKAEAVAYRWRARPDGDWHYGKDKPSGFIPDEIEPLFAPQPSGQTRAALESIADWLKINKRSVLYGMSRREIDGLMSVLHEANVALAVQEKQPTGMWPDWGDRPDGFDGPGGAE
jgi:hypothetical protein